MNRITTLCMILALAVPVYAQTPEALLRAAMDRELADGDLKGAIARYQKILDSKTASREVKAKALLHQADSHRKLGNAEARRLYERLLKDYADQTVIAAEARTRMGSVSQGEAGVRERFLFGGADVRDLGRASRDGRILAFQPKETNDWWYFDVATGTKGLLWKPQGLHNDTRPTPSPDGKRVARSVSTKPREWSGYQFHVAARGGDSDVNVTPGTSFYGGYVTDWHPSKNELLAIARQSQDSAAAIIIVDIAAKTHRTVYEGSAGRQGWIAQALFTNDGNHIVFTPSSAGQRENGIHIVPVSGGPAVSIPATALDLRGFLGNRLIYLSRVSGSHDVWSLALRDGKPDGSPEVVKKQIGEYRFVGITPNGSLLYGMATTPEELFRAQIAPSAVTERLTTPFTGASYGPAYSSDGRFLAYTTGPVESQQLRVRELATGAETPHNVALARWAKLRWFPDGKSLLISGAASRGQFGFHRYDLASKQVTPLFQFSGEARSDAASTAVPTPDGQSFVFKRRDSKGGSAVSIGDVVTGAVRDLLRMEQPREMRMFALSPAGKSLAISFRDGTFDKIAIVPVGGGDLNVIYEYPKDEYARAWGALAWSADGKHVLYQREYKSVMDQAWRVPAAGGTPEALFTSEIIRDFAVHPDGKTIAWQANSMYYEVYSMDNLAKVGK